MKHAVHFVEALARGTLDRSRLISTVLENQVKEMI